MRFTEAATDLYKNVKKEAEATGVIPKPKPAAKPAAKKQRRVAVSFELNGKTHDLEWMGDGSDEEITRIVQGVKDTLGVGEYSDRFLPAAGGAKPTQGIPMTAPRARPAPPKKTTLNDPKYSGSSGPVPMGTRKSTSVLDLLNPVNAASFAGTVASQMPQGALEAGAGTLEDAGKGAGALGTMLKGRASKGKAAGWIPSKMIGSLMSPTDPQQAKADEAYMESFDLAQNTEGIKELLGLGAGALRSVYGDSSPEVDAFVQQVKKNPLETAVTMLSGIDGDTWMAYANGDEAAGRKVAAFLRGGALTLAAGAGAGLVAKGAAAGRGVAKVGRAAMGADEVADALATGLKGIDDPRKFDMVGAQLNPRRNILPGGAPMVVAPRPVPPKGFTGTGVAESPVKASMAPGGGGGTQFRRGFTPKPDPGYSGGETPDLVGMADAQRGMPPPVAMDSPIRGEIGWPEDGLQPNRARTGVPFSTMAHHGSRNLDEIKASGFDPAQLGTNTKARSAKEGFFFSKGHHTARAYRTQTWEVVAGQELRDEVAELAREVAAALKGTKFGGQAKFTYGAKNFSELDAKILAAASRPVSARSTGLNEVVTSFDTELFNLISLIHDAKRAGKDTAAWESAAATLKSRRGEFIVKAKSNVGEFDISMDNPYVYDMGGSEYRDKSYADIIKEAKANGHDGVVILNTYDGSSKDDIYVVFDTKQIQPAKKAPTSARYGPNYGTPQPGQGQRVGYPTAQPSTDTPTPPPAQTVVDNLSTPTPTATPKLATPAPSQRYRVPITVRYGGKSYEISNDADIFAWGNLTGGTRKEINRLRAEAAEATDIDLSRDLQSQANALEGGLNQDIEDFFADFERRQRMDAGIEDDLDARFAAIAGGDANVAKTAADELNAFLDGGVESASLFTPDALRRVGRSLMQLAVDGMAKGQDFATWAAGIASQFGQKIGDMAQSAWDAAKRWWDTPADVPGGARAGAINPERRGLDKLRDTSLSQEIMGAAPMPQPFRQSATNSKGKTYLKKPNTAAVATALQNRALDRLGGYRVVLTPKNARQVVEALSDAVADEAVAVMRMGGRGHGFYSKSIAETDRLLRQLAPNATDADVRLFHIISSPVSNGNKPQSEVKFAIDFWLEFVNSRSLPTTHPKGNKFPGMRGPSIAKGMGKLSRLFYDLGNDTGKILEWLTTTHTPQELRKYGNFAPGQHEAALDGKFFGTAILGPKVGKYAGNKVGIRGTTKDLWYYRGANRIVGQLFVKKGKVSDTGFMGGKSLETQVANEANALAARKLGLLEEEVQELLWGNEQDIYASMGVKQNSQRLADGVRNWAKENGISLTEDLVEDYRWDNRLVERRNQAVMRGAVQGHGQRNTPGPTLPGDAFQQGQAYVFASPNILEDTTLDDALRATGSSEHARIRSIMDDVVAESNASGYSTTAIGDWADGAENTVAIRLTGVQNYDQLKNIAADLGLRTARGGAPQKAVIPFMADIDGPDALYDFTLKNLDLSQARKLLDDLGIQFRTLVPGQSGTRVVVFDEGAQLGTKVAALTDVAPVSDVYLYRGKGEFLGSWDSRAGGLNEYRKYATPDGTSATATRTAGAAEAPDYRQDVGGAGSPDDGGLRSPELNDAGVAEGATEAPSRPARTLDQERARVKTLLKKVQQPAGRNKGATGGFTVSKATAKAHREMIEAMGAFASDAILKGVDAARFVTNMVLEFGRSIKPFAAAAYAKARALGARMSAPASVPGGTRAGAFRPKPRGGAPAPKLNPGLIPGHNPEPQGRSITEWIKYGLFTDASRASLARKALEKASGEKLEGGFFDIEEGINRQSRQGHKIEDTVEKGIMGPDGKRTSMGVPQIRKMLEDAGIDPNIWMAYRTALRENELWGQGRGTIKPETVAEYAKQIDEILQWVDDNGHADVFAKVDAEWQKLIDSHLKMYEEYGLKPKGWADEVRAENQFYYPLSRVKSQRDVTMAAVDPKSDPSPGGKVNRAGSGGTQVLDGFTSMAMQIEHTIRTGEATADYLPYLSRAADTEGMEMWVKEITPSRVKSDAEAAGDPFDIDLGDLAQKAEDTPGTITIYDKGKKRIFELDPILWDTIRGGMPVQQNSLMKTLVQMPSNVARSATTGGLAPMFGLVFNPMLDMMSSSITHGITPVGWVRSFKDAVMRGGTYHDAVKAGAYFNSKGIRDFLDQKWLYDPDARNTFEKALDKAAESKGIKIIKSPIELIKYMTQTMEETTRLAAFNKGKSAALRKGLDLKAAEREAAMLASQTMNFGEAGALAKRASRAGINYAAVPFQSRLAHWKSFKRNPAKYLARLSAIAGAPSVAEWMLYHEDEEWQNMPDYIKYGGLMFRSGVFTGNPKEGRWVHLRMPAEVMALVRIPMFAALEGKFSAGTLPEMAKDEIRNTVPGLPTSWALLAQWGYHEGTGGTIDTRFWNQKAYPSSAKKPDEANLTPDQVKNFNAKEWTKKVDTFERNQQIQDYKFWRQQIDTLFGSTGRLITRQAAYQMDKDKPENERREKRPPSIFQRYLPEPIEDKNNKNATVN